MGKWQTFVIGEIITNNIKYVKEADSNTVARKVEVECHCGNIFTARLGDLKNGSIKSCGCYKDSMKPSKYKTGDIIGNNITFIEDVHSEKIGRFAKLRCHCGKEFISQLSNITKLHTKSCGCLVNTPPPNKLDIKTGDIINGITFLEEVPSDLNHRKAKFKCHCGTEFITNISSVNTGKTKSCGCSKLSKDKIHNFNKGDILGNNLIFIQELSSNTRDRKALVQCTCGTIFKTNLLLAKQGKIQSCGCKRKIQYIPNEYVGDSNIKYIKDINEKSSNRLGLFECHCGSQFVITFNAIRGGGTKSCGCIASKPEIEIKDFVKSLGVSVRLNDRKTIRPRELDIVIPEHNIAIEFNGLFWHSELQGKDSSYHIGKSKECKELGLNLIHIFEHQWKFKQDIVKDIIRKRLGIVETRIFARKCIVKEVDTISAKQFIEDNHLQGYTNATYKIGLYYEDELISMMTFGKSRYDKKHSWELIRFANKLGINVLGGAAKILKYFRGIQHGSIVSYCDKSIFSGQLYNDLGFKYSHTSKPNYFYFDRHLNIHSRVAFQKHKLKDKLEIFDPSKTEWENMLANKFNRYWDCGNDVYILETNF